MTVKTLKEKCRKNGLKVSGTKQELINRLQNPTKNDIAATPAKMIRISLGWNDDRRQKISSLIEKGFAKLLCYATDNFVYEVNKEKWTQILSNKK